MLRERSGRWPPWCCGTPGNGYGIARGLSANRNGGPALTEWLTTSLNQLGGWRPAGRSVWNAGGEGDPLRAISTNLSEQRPYRLPFENHRLSLEAEMRDYFPPEVVDTSCGTRSRAGAWRCRRVPLPPEAATLPVVMATRAASASRCW